MSNPSLDYGRELREEIVSWLANYLTRSQMNGFVIGLSGGVDSTVLALMGREAAQRTGNEALCLILPMGVNRDDYNAAMEVVERQNLAYKEVDLRSQYSEYKEVLGPCSEEVVWTNIRARLRSTTIYFYSNKLDCIYLGTVNKGEFTIGYFPKNASAGDLLPLADLLKREIRKIGETYNISNEIIERKASGCIWANTAEEEWGFSERELDMMIKHNENRNKEGKPKDIKSRKWKKFIELEEASSHKRSFYPIYKKSI